MPVEVGAELLYCVESHQMSHNRITCNYTAASELPGDSQLTLTAADLGKLPAARRRRTAEHEFWAEDRVITFSC